MKIEDVEMRLDLIPKGKTEGPVKKASEIVAGSFELQVRVNGRSHHIGIIEVPLSIAADLTAEDAKHTAALNVLDRMAINARSLIALFYTGEIRGNTLDLVGTGHKKIYEARMAIWVKHGER